MKQLVQEYKSRQTALIDVPAPQVSAGCVLIQTTRTLVSLGTERMVVEFGNSSLIEKAQNNPAMVKQVIEKVKSEGLLSTIETVKDKLNKPASLGYCNVGKVVAVGKGVTDYKIGDRVASNGNHAEYVCVPKNLVAHIPDSVSDEEAAFTVIGSIALEGIRLQDTHLGDNIVVIGLGLIGQIAVQLLKASGCNVIGVDFDQKKVDMANSFGITAINPSKGADSIKFVEEFTNGVGADGVLITASSKGDDIIHEACVMSRKRGKVVLVGVVGLNIDRNDFYAKELTFQVSCSYGPGRYDEEYEQRGHDYPIGYVRWTENRNFNAILNAIANRQIDVKSLISEEVELDNFMEIYGDMRKEGSIASILKFPENSVYAESIKLDDSKFVPTKGVMGIVGAGGFTQGVVLPALVRANANVKYVSAKTNGLSARVAAKKVKAEIATTDYTQIIKDPEVDLVLCTTRHDLHARMIVESLNAGKSVFVEKPLCVNQEQLDSIVEAYSKAQRNQTVSVGFNRRFSPYAVKMKELIGNGPVNIVATMNAGFIPKDFWVHDMEVGGGRIIGEACHYIDLCSYLTGSEVESVCVNYLGNIPEDNCDNMSILLRYKNGSNAVVNYWANGSKDYPKERIEAHSQGKTLVIDNWKKLQGYGTKWFSKMDKGLQKGHREEFALLNDRIKNGGDPLIPFELLVNTTKATFACLESMKSKQWVSVK